MSNSPGIGHLVLLLKTVARLGLPAEDQVSYLRQMGVLPSVDELALEFSDGVVLLPQFVANGWLAQGDAELIQALDEMLSRMSGPAHNEFWTEEALNNASEWKEVRQRARAVMVRRS